MTDAPQARVDTVTKRRLSGQRARGLTLWSVAAILTSPAAIVTSGVSLAFAAGLVVVAAIMQVRGFDARRPLAAGIVSLVIGAAVSGALQRYVVRPVEVKGHEAAHQGQVEQRFDHAFDRATEAPQGPGDAGTQSK